MSGPESVPDPDEERLLWKLYTALSGERKYRLVRIRSRAKNRRALRS